MNIVIEILPATDPRHEAAVEAMVVETLRRRIQQAVQLMVCQVHGRSPSIRATGRFSARAVAEPKAEQSEGAKKPASAAERRGNPSDSLPFSAAEASARFDFNVTGCCVDFTRRVKWALDEL